MKKTNEELAQGLTEQIMLSDGWGGGALADNRIQALKYYYGEPRGDELPGCSSVISTDVADMLEAVIAGMMPALEADNVVEFEALSKDDETRARIESQAVNWLIMSKNRGYTLFQQSFRDALLMRNGFTKTWVKTETTKKKSTFVDLPDEVFLMIGASVESGTTRKILSSKETETGWTVTVEDTITERELVVNSVDPCACYFTSGWHEIDLYNIPFFAERILYTRSDLIKMGFSNDIVDGLPPVTLDLNSGESARNNGLTTDLQGWESSQDVIECFECYWLVDVDGDGVAERRKFLLAGNDVLLNEPYPFVPYATGTGFLQPHRVVGLSLYDKLKMVQDTKTGTMRQMLDCFYNGNVGRLGYVKGLVNLDHLSNPMPSGLVEISDPNALVPIPSTDIGPSAQAMLNYMDTVRSARGGASLDLQTAEAQIMGGTAQGIERQYSVREMLAAMMTRTLAETLIACTYLNVHRAVRAFFRGDITFRTRADYGTTKPDEWPERDRVIVRSGLSPGEQRKKVGALTGIIQQQTAMMQGGLNGVLVNLSGIYQASLDWARASGIDNPESYFIDPGSPESQQAQQQQAAQAQQQQQIAMALQQMQLQIAQQQQAIERWKHETELQFKYYDAQLDAELKEAQMTGDNVTRITVEGMKKSGTHDDYRKGE